MNRVLVISVSVIGVLLVMAGVGFARGGGPFLASVIDPVASAEDATIADASKSASIVVTGELIQELIDGQLAAHEAYLAAESARLRQAQTLDETREQLRVATNSLTEAYQQVSVLEAQTVDFEAQLMEEQAAHAATWEMFRPTSFTGNQHVRRREITVDTGIQRIEMSVNNNNCWHPANVGAYCTSRGRNNAAQWFTVKLGPDEDNLRTLYSDRVTNITTEVRAVIDQPQQTLVVETAVNVGDAEWRVSFFPQPDAGAN